MAAALHWAGDMNLVAALPLVVLAISQQEPASEPRLAPAQEAQTSVDLKSARYSDAGSDRVLLFSTAQTHPAGTFFFSDYEIIVLQFGYAFTDSFQLTLTGVPPLIKDQPYVFDLTGKYNLYRGEVFQAAVIAAATTVSFDGEQELLGRLGGVAQFCLNASCRMSFSLNVGAGFAGATLDEGVVPITTSGGLILGVTDLISVLVEPAYAFAVAGGKDGGVEGVEGFLLNYGVRLSGPAWALDLAFLRPVGSEDLSGALILGIPFLSFTYRGLPDA